MKTFDIAAADLLKQKTIKFDPGFWFGVRKIIDSKKISLGSRNRKRIKNEFARIVDQLGTKSGPGTTTVLADFIAENELNLNEEIIKHAVKNIAKNFEKTSGKCQILYRYITYNIENQKTTMCKDIGESDINKADEGSLIVIDLGLGLWRCGEGWWPIKLHNEGFQNINLNH